MLRYYSVLAFVFLKLVTPTQAQVTGSGIRGAVTATAGELPENASVQAIHIPTGSAYTTSTQKGGIYTLPNLRSGGPYAVIFSAVGFSSDTLHALYLTLGNFETINVSLQPFAQALDVVVVNVRRVSLRRTGVGTSIGHEQLERLPTLSRSLQDFIRYSPQANGNSLAGTNYRYNNLSIDGAALNDAFGFTEPASGAGGSQATSTPGSLARTQPISLEAVQEVQVEISPYTVTLGNFTGGSINAVTRSGTNILAGSVFFFGRNQLLTGGSADARRQPIDDFYDFQTGFRIGGPIRKNKLFFLTAFEVARRKEPVAFAPGSAGAAIPYQVTKDLYDTVLKRYNYDLGTSHRLSLALDVFNLSNLISSEWGRQYYVPNILNSSYQLLTIVRNTTATPPELNFSNPGTTPWQYDPLLSRTQGLLTLRYSW